MATAKQIAANRRNAQKSTGPNDTTQTRWNSVKHGLTAANPVLPHEDEAAFEALRAELIDSWQPANAQELLLVDQIVLGHWRMARSQRFENALLRAQLRILSQAADLEGLEDEALAVTLLNPEKECGYRSFFRYDARAQATLYRAIDRLRQLQTERKKENKEKLASFCTPPRVLPAPPNNKPVVFSDRQRYNSTHQVRYRGHVAGTARVSVRDSVAHQPERPACYLTPANHRPAIPPGRLPLGAI